MFCVQSWSHHHMRNQTQFVRNRVKEFEFECDWSCSVIFILAQFFIRFISHSQMCSLASSCLWEWIQRMSWDDNQIFERKRGEIYACAMWARWRGAALLWADILSPPINSRIKSSSGFFYTELKMMPSLRLRDKLKSILWEKISTLYISSDQ